MERKDADAAVLDSAVEEVTLEEKEIIYQCARSHALRRLGLQIHALIYAAVMLLLLFINLLATPQVWWAVWPALGWGLGLSVHWLVIARLLPDYQAAKEREIARRLELRNS